MRKQAAELPATMRAGSPGRPSSDRSQWLANAPHNQMLLSSGALVELAPLTSPMVARSAHIHGPLELGVMLAGEQKRLFSDFTFRALPGDVWLIPMWEPHGWEIPYENTERVVIHFLPSLLGSEMIGDTSWLGGFAVAPRLRPQVSGEQEREQVMVLARALWTETQDQRYGWVTATRAYLLLLLTVLYREWDRPEMVSPETHAGGLARIMPVVSAVQRQLGRPLAVTEAARLCNLSRWQFRRVFSQTMGVGFQEFALRARLGHAESLLTTTDLPVEAIAGKAGFVDRAHLHRHFTKRYGCAPGVFRKQVQARGRGAH